MNSFGKLYADVINYPIYKNRLIVEKGWSNETDEPYRKGTCLVIKLPLLSKAFVLGFWGKPQSEADALMGAIMGKSLDVSTEEIMEW